MYAQIERFFTEKKIEVRRVDAVGSGAGSRVYRADTNRGVYAVKTALYPERRERVIREFGIRKQIIELGIGFAPRPFWTDIEIFPNGASVFEYIEGKKLVADGKTDNTTLSGIAQMLSRLHPLDLKIMADGFSMALQLLNRTRTLVDKTVSNNPRLMNDELRTGLYRALDEVDEKLYGYRGTFSIGLSGRCHDDVAGNIVVGNDGKLWLVDWENSCVEDTIEEVVCVSSSLRLSSGQAQFLFREYQNLFPAASEINFSAMSRAYLLPEPICNICYSIDFLDVNLRHNLDPDRCVDELVRVALSAKDSMSGATSELLTRGAMKIMSLCEDGDNFELHT